MTAAPTDAPAGAAVPANAPTPVPAPVTDALAPASPMEVELEELTIQGQDDWILEVGPGPHPRVNPHQDRREGGGRHGQGRPRQGHGGRPRDWARSRAPRWHFF